MTVVSAQRAIVVPPWAGPNQNCRPQTVRFPDGGTIRSTSTAGESELADVPARPGSNGLPPSPVVQWPCSRGEEQRLGRAVCIVAFSAVAVQPGWQP
jgi:hypothetical protein